MKGKAKRSWSNLSEALIELEERGVFTRRLTMAERAVRIVSPVWEVAHIPLDIFKSSASKDGYVEISWHELAGSMRLATSKTYDPRDDAVLESGVKIVRLIEPVYFDEKGGIAMDLWDTEDIATAVLVLDYAMAHMDAYVEPVGVGFGLAGPFEEYGYAGDWVDDLEQHLGQSYREAIYKDVCRYVWPRNASLLFDLGLLDGVVSLMRSSVEKGVSLGSCCVFFDLMPYVGRLSEALQDRGFAEGQVASMVFEDRELFCACDPEKVDTMCEAIRSTSFDPEDEFAWADYFTSNNPVFLDFA